MPVGRPGCPHLAFVPTPPALPRRRARLSAAEARRVVLGAQGLAGPRPAGEPGARQLRAMVERLGVVQIDSVNVLQRAHYLPGFSRLGPYPLDALDRLAHYAPRRLFRDWGDGAAPVAGRGRPPPRRR